MAFDTIFLDSRKSVLINSNHSLLLGPRTSFCKTPYGPINDQARRVVRSLLSLFIWFLLIFGAVSHARFSLRLSTQMLCITRDKPCGRSAWRRSQQAR